MDTIPKNFKHVGKMDTIFTVSLLLVTTAWGAGGNPGIPRGSPLVSYAKHAKYVPLAARAETSAEDYFFAPWFDDVTLHADEHVQPEEDPVRLSFDSIVSSPEQEITTVPNILPTRVFNSSQSVPSSSTVLPTVTVTVTSTSVVSFTVHEAPVTSTIFITVLPHEMVGSMDAFFREMTAMTAVIRLKMSSLHEENRGLMEKVMRLSRPSLLIDSLRKMPPYERKLLIARMEQLMSNVSRMNDKRFKQNPVNLKMTLEKLAKHLENLNPLVYKK